MQPAERPRKQYARINNREPKAAWEGHVLDDHWDTTLKCVCVRVCLCVCVYVMMVVCNGIPCRIESSARPDHPSPGATKQNFDLASSSLYD